MDDEWIIGQEAHVLALSGIQTALIVTLVRKGLLTVYDAREMYETALLNLESNQALLREDDQQVFQRARSILESGLRSLEMMPKSRGAT